MVDETVAEAPAPGSPEKPQFSTEGARGDWASPATRPAQGKGVVYVDFGKGRVYALTDDCEDVFVFDSLEDVVKKLYPTTIIIDSLPNKHQKEVAELVKNVSFLKLKDLRKLGEERKNNGVRKSDENDVRLLRQLYYRRPDDFQPLYTTPEELTVRALTELWALMSLERKSAKYARTTTDNPVAVEAHKTLRRLVEKLAEEIHEEALKLPLYRKAVEEFGLKGPALAYIVSHDINALTMLARDRLELRYAMRPRAWKRRPLRSRLLILLAWSVVSHKHPRYHPIFNRYYEKFKDRPRKHWKAVLRVAKTILRDIRKLARENGQAQKAGPPA